MNKIAKVCFLGLLCTWVFVQSCSKSSVDEPAPDPCAGKNITLTGSITPASAPGATNGSINATAAGSSGFTYSLNAGATQTSGSFTSLAQGTYTITAKDANGCAGSASFTVTSTSCPTITLTTTSTNTTGTTATNGSITATAAGGLGPYTFSKDNGATFQASGTFSNLAANTYGVVAKDANGCLSSSNNVIVGATCPTINASASTTTTVKCESGTGSVTITATGSTGFTYNINGGSFQTSNVFNTLPAANHTYGVRDANGCATTGSATVALAPAGSLFNNVKAILAANCTSCHGGSSPQSGINYTDDCTIVSQSARIKARGVDANPSQMPPSGPGLSAADKAAIVNWVNAGGKHNN
ncbi:MAG: hypothetical protein WEA59_06325 [Ferruginibacter sp.]